MAHVPPPPSDPTPNEWTSQFRRGVLELCVLELLRHQPNYGYDIVTALEDLGPLAAGENTLYPLLRRLKADGHLETFTRDSPAGPARQYYRVTAKGERRRAALAREWGQLVDAVNRCLTRGVPA